MQLNDPKIGSPASKGGRVTLTTTNGVLEDGFVEFKNDQKLELCWLDSQRLKRIPSLPDPAKSAALIISIGTSYGSGGLKDYGALKAVPDVARELIAQFGHSGFGRIVHLPEDKATAQRARHEFKALGKEKLDRLLVVFMGHGEIVRFNPQGDRFSTDSAFVTTGFVKKLSYTSSEVEEMCTLEQMRNDCIKADAKHVLCIVDACYSGVGDLPFSEGQLSSLPPTSSGALNSILKWSGSPSRCLFTSTTRNQLAYRNNDAGLFSRVLVTGLSGLADGEGGARDHVITTEELYNYCARNTLQQVKELSQSLTQSAGIRWLPMQGYDPKSRQFTYDPPDAQFFFVRPVVSY